MVPSSIYDNFGLFLVIAALVIISLIVLFAKLKLSNINQALGMPVGSVRALIALSALMLFGIFAISVISWGERPATKVHLFEGAAMGGVKLLNSGLLAVEGKKGNISTVEVVNLRPANEAMGLTKQIFATIASILATIIGFYFGSRVALPAALKPNAVASPDGSVPSPTKPDPLPVNPGALEDAVKRTTDAKERLEEIKQSATATRAKLEPGFGQILADGQISIIDDASLQIANCLKEVKQARQAALGALNLKRTKEANDAAQSARRHARIAASEVGRAESTRGRLKYFAMAEVSRKSDAIPR
jgi:uncharacterized protein YukE